MNTPVALARTLPRWQRLGRWPGRGYSMPYHTKQLFPVYVHSAQSSGYILVSFSLLYVCHSLSSRLDAYLRCLFQPHSIATACVVHSLYTIRMIHTSHSKFLRIKRHIAWLTHSDMISTMVRIPQLTSIIYLIRFCQTLLLLHWQIGKNHYRL